MEQTSEGVWFLCHRIEHLGLNVALQLLVGVPLEMVHGAARIGLVYMAGVVAGRLVSLILCLWCQSPKTDPRLPEHIEESHYQSSCLLGLSRGLERGLPPREVGVWGYKGRERRM